MRSRLQEHSSEIRYTNDVGINNWQLTKEEHKNSQKRCHH